MYQALFLNKDILTKFGDVEAIVFEYQESSKIGMDKKLNTYSNIYLPDGTKRYVCDSDIAFCAKCATFNCFAGKDDKGNQVECSKDNLIPWEEWEFIAEDIETGFDYDIYIKYKREWVRILSISDDN